MEGCARTSCSGICFPFFLRSLKIIRRPFWPHRHHESNNADKEDDKPEVGENRNGRYKISGKREQRTNQDRPPGYPERDSERQMEIPSSMPPTRLNRFVSIIKINSPCGISPCASSGALAFRKGNTKAITGSKPMAIRRNKKMNTNPAKPIFPTRSANFSYTPGNPNASAIAPIMRITDAAEPSAENDPSPSNKPSIIPIMTIRLPTNKLTLLKHLKLSVNIKTSSAGSSCSCACNSCVPAVMTASSV